jgi:methylene-tetrahydromethanopterin dehydrogenase
MTMKNILVYFDMDKRPSPFDILFAYDVGFDIVLPFSEVAAEEITALVQDAMFPRGPKGAKYTTLFFGGTDLDAVEKMAKKAKKTLFPPFQLSVALDPKGAHTTSSAIVAKVLEALSMKGEALEGKKAAVLGGCGRVGRVTSRILASEGVEVTMVDVIEEVTAVAERVAEMVGGKVQGVRAISPAEIVSAAKDCEIVIAAGPAGVELLPEEFVPGLEKCLVAADVNAVPPAGIGGIKAKYDKREKDGILTIGALAIGNLRNKIEAKMLQTAMESEGVFLDYTDAFGFAKELAKY